MYEAHSRHTRDPDSTPDFCVWLGLGKKNTSVKVQEVDKEVVSNVTTKFFTSNVCTAQ